MKLTISEAFGRRIGFRHLRLAVALGEHGSLSRAAHDLAVSQPTATKLLQDLEGEIGVKLFRRTNRGVVPTDVGAVLVEQAFVLLTQLSHVGQTMQDMALGFGGRVAVGTLLTASSFLLPTSIARLRVDRPKVTVAVVEGTDDILLPRLVAGDLDFLVGRLPDLAGYEEIERQPLYLEEIKIVVRIGHPLLAGEQPGLDDYRAAEWILPPPGTSLRHQLDRSLFAAGILDPKCAVQSVSTMTNRKLVQTTDLLGVWPASLIDHDPTPEQFAILPLRLPALTSAIGISRGRGATISPAAEMLIAQLRSVAAETAS